jgi:hypothetical protein
MAKKKLIGESSMPILRYRGSDFVSRTVEFFPITSFYVDFFRPKFLRSRARARLSQPKAILVSGKASAQFQMFATSPKSYNENQCLAHIVASLQACHLDSSEFSSHKKKTRWCGIGNRIHHSVPSGFFRLRFFYVNFSEQTPASDFAQGYSGFRPPDGVDGEIRDIVVTIQSAEIFPPL